MDDLVDRARALVAPDRRAVLGLCGPPGAGKSTVAERLVRTLGELAVVVPLDGFHLHDDELARLGRADRKGAPDTFDVAGYVALLRRLRVEDEVYAPTFDRDRELALAGAVPVLPQHRLVVTEGNYLLLDEPGWREVRPEIDACWYVDLDPAERVHRLVDRHVRHGRSRAEAEEWVARSDEANTRLVVPTRDRADLVVAAG